MSFKLTFYMIHGKRSRNLMIVSLFMVVHYLKITIKIVCEFGIRVKKDFC